MATVVRPRRTSRVTGLLVACAVAALVLTGCIKVDADVTIDSEALGSGTFAFELQKDAAGFLGINDLGSFEGNLTEGELSDQGGLGSFDSCATSESETGFVYTCTFADEEFTDPEGLWTITADDAGIVFRMTSQGQAAGEEDEAAALLGDASMGTINVNVTFPGPITQITGEGAEQTSDTSATITGSMTTAIDVTITSEKGGSGFPLSVLLIVLLAFAVLGLIVVAATMLIMRRRHPQAEETVAADAPVVPAVGAAAATQELPAAPPGDAGAIEAGSAPESGDDGPTTPETPPAPPEQPET